MSTTDDQTNQLHLSLRAQVFDTLLTVDGPSIDTDLIFEKIEGALRKHLKLSFAQCDHILADARADIEQMFDDQLGFSGAIYFGRAVAAIENLIDEELGDGDGGPDDAVATSSPRLRVIK